MIDTNKNIGKFEIFVNGKKVDTIYNRVMDTVLKQQVEILQGSTPDLEIKYLALGTSDAAVTNTDTQLGNEIFRMQYSNRSKVSKNELKHKFKLLAGEVVDTVREIGIFGGTGATATTNSGTLISRILWTRDITANEELDFIRTDKVVRG